MKKITEIEYCTRIPRQPSFRFERIGRYCRLQKSVGGIELTDYAFETDGTEKEEGLARVYDVPEEEFAEIVSYIEKEQLLETMKEDSIPGLLSGNMTSMRIIFDDRTRIIANTGFGNLAVMLFALQEKCKEPCRRIPLPAASQPSAFWN